MKRFLLALAALTLAASPVHAQAVRGVYKATPPTLTDGVQEQLQLDTSGNLKTVAGGTGSSADQVQGNVASGATDAGNPVKVGGKYNATQPTFTDGQRGDIQIGARGSLRVELYGAGSTTAVSTGGGTGDAVGSLNWLQTHTYNLVFNGSTWDRVKKPSATSRILTSAATTNATVVKASAGDVFRIRGTNTNAAARYLKLYNLAVAPTVGTSTPAITIRLAPSSDFNIDLGGHYFSTGIAYALTTGVADADTGAVGSGDIEAMYITYQ